MPGAPGEPFFLLNFHQLCNDPVVTVAGLANFIEVDSYSGNITELIKAYRITDWRFRRELVETPVSARRLLAIP